MESIPATTVGEKKGLQLFTYQELHAYILELTRILEEVYEMGVMKGTIKQYTKDGLDHDQENGHDQQCP